MVAAVVNYAGLLQDAPGVAVKDAAGGVDADAPAGLSLAAAAAGEPLPAGYHRLFWTWLAFGFPAFAAVLAILWLMITRPQPSLL